MVASLELKKARKLQAEQEERDMAARDDLLLPGNLKASRLGRISRGDKLRPAISKETQTTGTMISVDQSVKCFYSSTVFHSNDLQSINLRAFSKSNPYYRLRAIADLDQRAQSEARKEKMS